MSSSARDRPACFTPCHTLGAHLQHRFDRRSSHHLDDFVDRDLRLLHELKHRKQKLPLPLQELPDRALVRPIPLPRTFSSSWWLRVGVFAYPSLSARDPRSHHFSFPLSGTFNYGWDSFIKKAIVAIAAEVDGRKIGRIRLRWVPDLSAPVLRGFVKDSIAPASTVHTDGWPSYQGLAKLGFRHTVTNLSTSGDPAHVLMSAVHRVASLLKRWVLGTLQGGIAREHLPYYLDEFTFRFNRRTSRARGLLFYRLLEQAVQCAPTPASALYLGTGRGKRPAEPR